MTIANVELAHQSTCRIGEGVLWSVDEQAIYWLDILGNILYRKKGDDVKTWSFKQGLTSIGFATDNKMVGTFVDGFYALDLVNGAHKILAAPELNYDIVRFNDGAVDTHGHYWSGTMHTDDPFGNPIGALYRFSANGSYTKQDDNYHCTNGPCFTPDGKIMYHTDTLVRQKVYRCELDDQGNFVRRSTFIHFEHDSVYPDGMCLDSNGNLWVALWGGWGVNQYSPDGRLLQHIKLPVAQVTKCVFGGINNDTLFISTASEYLSDEDQLKQPLAGALFAVKTNVQGIANNVFKFLVHTQQK